MKIEKVEVREIADQFGTPVYVYSLETLRQSINEIKKLSPVTRYAMKASSNARILQEMLANEVKIDAVSVYEVQRAIRAGYKAEDICFTSDVFFNADDVNYCLENNIFCNCGTLGMVEEYGQALKKKGAGSPKISIRINPGEGAGHSKKTNTGGPYSKHGIWHQNLDDVKQILKEYGLTLSGIGGLPYQYDPDQPQEDITGYKAIIDERAKVLKQHFGREVVCEIEPGRRFVAGCGYLIGEVRSLNHTFDEDGKRIDYVLTNVGFCHLIRPMAYGSFHPIWFDGERLGPKQNLIIAGPVCESGDVLTQKDEEPVPRKLPMPKSGDLIVIGGAGAYGHVMSSNYNSQPLIPEVIIDGDICTLTRKRQTLDDIMQAEI